MRFLANYSRLGKPSCLLASVRGLQAETRAATTLSFWLKNLFEFLVL